MCCWRRTSDSNVQQERTMCNKKKEKCARTHPLKHSASPAPLPLLPSLPERVGLYPDKDVNQKLNDDERLMSLKIARSMVKKEGKSCTTTSAQTI